MLTSTGGYVKSAVDKYVPTKPPPTLHIHPTFLVLAVTNRWSSVLCFKTSLCGRREGYAHKRKEHLPPLAWTQPEPNAVSTVPDELRCDLCKLLMENAAIVPCCGYSFCDNCELLLSLSLKRRQPCYFCLKKTLSFQASGPFCWSQSNTSVSPASRLFPQTASFPT